MCLSSSLLNESIDFQTVVVVHELLHLLVPNHGKLFKSLMNAYVPGWEAIARGRICTRCMPTSTINAPVARAMRAPTTSRTPARRDSR